MPAPGMGLTRDMQQGACPGLPLLGRAAHTDALWLDYSDASRQFRQVCGTYEPFNEMIHGKRAEGYGSEQYAPWMRSGRVLAKVREFDVQRQEDPTLAGGTRRHLDIRTGQQVFVGCGQHIMTQTD